MNTIKRVNRLKITASFILLLSFLLTAPVFAGEAGIRICENESEKESKKKARKRLRKKSFFRT